MNPFVDSSDITEDGKAFANVLIVTAISIFATS